MTAPSKDVVIVSREGSAGIVTIDNPPLNTLATAVRQGIVDAIAALNADATITAIILRGNGGTFSSGADLGELQTAELRAPLPNDVHAAVENSAKPVIAAVHGLVLGGGFELALAAHYRVAATGSVFSLPEVNLGILPGAGGTQRLPRLIGAEKALEVILTGGRFKVAQLQEWGAVDAVADGDPLSAALAFAATLTGPRPVRGLSVNAVSLPEGGFEAVRAATRKKQGLAIAPERIVDCVEAAVELPFDQGLAKEYELFSACLESPQCKALLHLFFAERKAGKIKDLPADVKPRDIKTVGVIGAGVMGAGIATAFVGAGFNVVVVERSEEALAKGIATLHKNFDSQVQRGKLSEKAAAEAKGRAVGVTDIAALNTADLVIEAVFESLDIKRAVMETLGAVCRPGAIIATNTSTLNVDVLAEASGRPADVVGLHFFSPAHIMRLLEVVRGAKTAPDVLQTAMNLSRALRKVAVVSGVCYGFIGNRMLEGYLRETDAMVLEGVAPERIDRAVERFGFAMGPCRMMDMSGVDLGDRLVRESKEAGIIPAYPAYRAMVCKLAAAGRLGQKNGVGYYRYDGRKPEPDPAVMALAADLAAELGITQRPDIGDDDIVARLVLPLINEAARILEEGIAQSAGDVDTVWATGYGFPALRGGPLHYADTLGLAAVRDGLQRFAASALSADDWAVAPLLDTLATENRRFADLG